MENGGEGRREEGKAKRVRDREELMCHAKRNARCSEKLCRVCFTDMRHTEQGATAGDLPIRVLYKSSSCWNSIEYYLY